MIVGLGTAASSLIAGDPIATWPLTVSTFEPGMRSSETRLGCPSATVVTA